MSHPFRTELRASRQPPFCVLLEPEISIDLIPSLIPCLIQGVTVYRAIKNSDTHIGDWIVLPGAGGGLGHLGDSPFFYDRFRPLIDDPFNQKLFSMRLRWAFVWSLLVRITTKPMAYSRF